MPTISLHGWDIVVEQSRKWMGVEKGKKGIVLVFGVEY